MTTMHDQNPLQDIESLRDLALTRQLIESVSVPGWDVLDSCSVSLLQFPTRNILLITCYADDFIPPAMYSRLSEIAQWVQQQIGRTHISLRHYQRNLVLRWNSEDLTKPNQTAH